MSHVKVRWAPKKEPLPKPVGTDGQSVFLNAGISVSKDLGDWH